MSEKVELEVTYGEKQGLPSYSSREFRASIKRTVEVEGPEEAADRVALMFDLLRAEVESQKAVD